MTANSVAEQALLPDRDPNTATRIASSMVRRIELDRLNGWHSDPIAGDIRHRSGKFFSITGLAVDIPTDPVGQWHQPIIVQPEIGILGIIVKEIAGVMRCLMQAKIEPGNANGLQLSPTVQATRSNYTRVHGGRSVPYLESFIDTTRSTIIADVRQSEQGSWFYQKRNRNMVVEVDEDIEVLDGFRWLSVRQLIELLRHSHYVNVQARTMITCLHAMVTGMPAAEAG